MALRYLLAAVYGFTIGYVALKLLPNFHTPRPHIYDKLRIVNEHCGFYIIILATHTLIILKQGCAKM